MDNVPFLDTRAANEHIKLLESKNSELKRLVDEYKPHVDRAWKQVKQKTQRIDELDAENEAPGKAVVAYRADRDMWKEQYQELFDRQYFKAAEKENAKLKREYGLLEVTYEEVLKDKGQLLDENAALRRKNKVVQHFGAWLEMVCHDDCYRLDGGGHSYASLLDYIWSVFEPLTAKETNDG